MNADADDWPDLRLKFRRIAAREGVSRIADEVPADRKTVYRLISGETQRPTRAVRAGIERVVHDHGAEKP